MEASNAVAAILVSVVIVAMVEEATVAAVAIVVVVAVVATMAMVDAVVTGNGSCRGDKGRDGIGVGSGGNGEW